VDERVDNGFPQGLVGIFKYVPAVDSFVRDVALKIFCSKDSQRIFKLPKKITLNNIRCLNIRVG